MNNQTLLAIKKGLWSQMENVSYLKVLLLLFYLWLLSVPECIALFITWRRSETGSNQIYLYSTF